MVETIKEIEAREVELKQILKELDDKKQQIIKDGHDGIEYELASLLHDALCTSSHTDGCGWYYDKGNWLDSSRKEYLLRAKNLIAKDISINFKNTNIEEVREFLNTLLNKNIK